jgi:hypothetical protein
MCEMTKDEISRHKAQNVPGTDMEHQWRLHLRNFLLFIEYLENGKIRKSITEQRNTNEYL